MRTFLIIFAFVAICGCAKAPYYDLRHPVYFKAEKSFWTGCNKDPKGEKACRKNRIEQMYKGFDQWFNYFEKADRPQAVFIASEKELPIHSVNSVIHLAMSDGFCGRITGKIDKGKWAGACYRWHQTFWGSPTKVRIVFKNQKEIVARSMAHEFGHALGLDDNYLPVDKGSVMSYTKPTRVTAHDAEVMCSMHYECGVRKKKRRKN